ncbi:MAG: hypothetical protein ACOVP8_00885, partial [Phycisphaerales bacterium]
RFPGFMNNSLLSLLSELVPTPRCHFLASAYTPWTLRSTSSSSASSSSSLSSATRRKTSVHDVMRRLLDPSNLTVSASLLHQHKHKAGAFVAALNVIQGHDIDPAQIHKGLQCIRDMESVRFVPWAPPSIQVALARCSPYVKHHHRVSGLMLANHTAIAHVFAQICREYDKMRAKKANLNHFQKQGGLFADGLAEFDESRDLVATLIDEYRESATESYLA